MKTTTSKHTTKNPFRAGSLSSAALITLTAFAIAGTAQTSADTHTWTGVTDGNWNDVGNWDVGIPTAGDDLIFSGTSNTATNNNLAVIGIAGIQFNNTTAGQSFSLAGSDINLTGPITTAAVIGGGTIEDTISLRLRPTGGVRDIDLGTDHNLNISGEIFGPQAIQKLGAGTLTLSNANTYSGGTNIRAGKVIFTDQDAFNNGNITLGIDAGTQELEFGANGMDLSNFTQFQNSGGKKTIRLDLAGTNTGTISGTVDIRRQAAGEAEFDIGTDNTLTLSGTVVTQAGGGAGITKEGAGTLRLTNATNTFGGRFYVNEGEVQIAESGRINDQLIEVASGATFRWSSSAQADGGNGFYDGGMSGDGTFIKDGSTSNLIVRNFSGASIANMEVHQGTLTGAGSNGALGGATTTNYLGEDGGSNNATMSWIGGINGTVTERAGIVVQAGTGTKTYTKGNSNDITDNTDITLNGDLTVNSASTGTFTLGGVISGSGDLTKTNAGTLELTGDSTYTGTTDVNAGTLLVNGNNSGATGAFNILSGATLGGIGTVGGATTLNSGGSLSAGDGGIGTLSFSNTVDVSSVGASGLLFDLQAGVGGIGFGDLVSMTTSELTIGTDTLGFNEFSFTDLGLSSSARGEYVYTLFDAGTGSVNGSLDSLDSYTSGLFAGTEWAALSIDGDNLILTVSVPEPSSAALFGLGGLALLLRRKRSDS